MLRGAEGESPGHRGGQGPGREQIPENGRLRKPVEGGGYLLQGTGRRNNGRNRWQVEGTGGEGKERLMGWEGEQVREMTAEIKEDTGDERQRKGGWKQNGKSKSAKELRT